MNGRKAGDAKAGKTFLDFFEKRRNLKGSKRNQNKAKRQQEKGKICGGMKKQERERQIKEAAGDISERRQIKMDKERL